jgi:hypothetical protein
MIEPVDAPTSTPDHRAGPSRRRFLRGAAALAFAALAAGARAQHGTPMQHGHGHAGAGTPADETPMLPPHDIPWDGGTCAFCGMTIATPAGAPQGEGFRERTYAQWVLAGAADGETEALHFESIACALNHAYVHGVRDGSAGTLYVTDAAGIVPAGAGALVSARRAVFHWGERLHVAMMARIIAFADDAGRDAHVVANPDEGRRARYTLTTLEDLAPLPEMNLIPLLARHAGLLDT